MNKRDMAEERQQKKIAAINDLSGYGRCSLTVAIPIISALRVQCCPVPTSILSNHTGFSTYFFDDYTDKMEPYIEKWAELGLEFDGIFSGFLGSKAQIGIVMSVIRRFKKEGSLVVIDPIMGDHGKAYKTYSTAMCQRMKELVRMGDIVTPNLTEACILTGREYREEGWSRLELLAMAGEIGGLGPFGVVITGVREGNYITNVVTQKGKEAAFDRSLRVGRERPGTGDVFSAIVAAEVVKGTSLRDASQKAARFVKHCVLKSEELHIPVENGVCFEEVLGELIK